MRATRQMAKIKGWDVNVQQWLQSERQVALMGDKVVKKILEKSIINGVNGEKAPLSLLKKNLPSRMIKKKLRTQILVDGRNR